MQINSNEKIHKLALLTKILMWISILVLLSFMLGTSWVVFEFFVNYFYMEELPKAILLMFGILFYGMALYISVSSLKTRIITTSDGLEYYGVGIHIKSSWENAARIELVGIARKMGIGVEVIKLHNQPEIIKSNWIGKLLFKYQNGIHLFEFGRWRSTPLGDEIRLYAPHLLF